MTTAPRTWAAPRWAWGVGLRREHFDLVADRAAEVDFLEVLSENFMRFGGRPRDVLEALKPSFPLVMHGVGLSIGSPDPLNERYLERLTALAERLDTPWFSDHLSYSSAFGVEYHDLIPLPFTREAVDHVVPRAREVQDRVGRPFLLENPSYYVAIPGAEMSEAEFLSTVATEADCGILLDINNVYVNSTNHGYDALEFLDALPLERITQVHIAGHDATGEFIVDTHGAHIDAPVFELYGELVRRLVGLDQPVWTLLEWDHGVPDLETLLAESTKVRATAVEAGAQAEMVPPTPRPEAPEVVPA
jgi:uncharacterized protein (UPF0276 family)